MFDLPPSAFHRSAPFDPRRRRGPVYAAFGLVLAVGAGGMIGYTAGYAADDTQAAAMTVRPVVACRAIPPAVVPAEAEAPARPVARPAVVVEARVRRERARIRRPARLSVVRAGPPVVAQVKAPVKAPVKERVKAPVRQRVRASVAAPQDLARTPPRRSPLEALIQEVRGDIYAQVIDRITGRSRR
ncbi:hypothetical protein [Nonomuraea sp. NPDC052265]|uniref:hypothetical protein n=1 Tax=Nonomuraea sp. NPDC052265 TaxID=3364374 RepID=UPI0037CBD3DA